VDVFAQRVVGWHTARTKHTDLVLRALRMGTWTRAHHGRPVTSVIHHSDAGSQYVSVRYVERLALEGLTPSVGSVGDAYDNALMETIVGLFKAECIDTTVFHPGPWKTLTDVEYATAEWVEWFNNRRVHSTLDYRTPAAVEDIYYAQTPAGEPETVNN
jgi:putative transposase